MIILRKKQKKVNSFKGVVVNSDFVHEEAAKKSRIFFLEQEAAVDRLEEFLKCSSEHRVSRALRG